MAEFLRNCWYVAMESTELVHKMFPRRILNEPVLFYRAINGDAVALRDRCPHRHLPLSMGKLIGDTVQCGYHGMQFDCSGKCIRIPTQDTIPENANIKLYPLVEKYGFVWIWMGDDEKADESLVPEWQSTVGEVMDLNRRLDPELHDFYDYKHVKGDYRLMVDNLMDLSHVGFVHGSTLGSEETSISQATGRQEVNGLIVSDYRQSSSVQAPPAFAAILPPDIGLVDTWNDIHFHVPCHFMLSFGASAAGQPRDTGACFLGIHILTPETPESTHYYFGSIDLNSDSPKAITDMLGDAGRFAFEEDLVIIEAQQKNLAELDPTVDGKIILQSDRASVMAQRLIKKFIKEEEQTLS